MEEESENVSPSSSSVSFDPSEVAAFLQPEHMRQVLEEDVDFLEEEEEEEEEDVGGMMEREVQRGLRPPPAEENFESFDDTPVKTLGHKLTFEELIEKQLKLEEEDRDGGGDGGEGNLTTTRAGGEAAAAKPKFKFLRKGERESKNKMLKLKEKTSVAGRKGGRERITKPNADGQARAKATKAEAKAEAKASAASSIQARKETAQGGGKNKFVEKFYDADCGDGYGDELMELDVKKTFEQVLGEKLGRLDREIDDDEDYDTTPFADGSYQEEEEEEEYDSLDDEDPNAATNQHDSSSGMKGHLSAERRAKWQEKRAREEMELEEFQQLEREVLEQLEHSATAASAAADESFENDDERRRTAEFESDFQDAGMMPSMLQQASFSGKSFSETIRGLSLEEQFDDTSKWDDEGTSEEEGEKGSELLLQDGEVASRSAAGSYAEQHARSVGAMVKDFLYDDDDDDDGVGVREGNRLRGARKQKQAPKRGGERAARPTTAPARKPPHAHQNHAAAREEGEGERPMSAIEEKHVKLLDQEIKKVVEEKKKYKRMQGEYKKRATQLDQAEQEFDKRREAEIENIQVMKEKAEKKIKRDRRVLDQQSRTLLSKIPSKKDREEIQQLEALLEKERATHKRKERTHKMNEDRLRRQVAELTRKNDELKDEIRRLEKRQLDAWSQSEAEKEKGKEREKEAGSKKAAKVLTESKTTNEAPLKREPAKAERRNSATTTTTEKGGEKAKKTRYANGTTKEVYANGDTIIHFTNGDIKKASGGTTEYYYSEVDTWHTTYHNGIEVFHFPSGQIEAHFPNGTKEVLFPDGIAHRLTDPEGEEHQLVDPEDLCEVLLKPKPQIKIPV